MIRRPPRSTQSRSSAASDVYKRQDGRGRAHRFRQVWRVYRSGGVMGVGRYEKFERVVLKCITDNEIPNDSEEDLIRAFKALDTDGKGYLTADELRELLTKNEEHFSNDEMTEMLAYAVDAAVSYTHLRAHETVLDLVCRLLLEKKKKARNRKEAKTD
eukprot:TRINITY_DN19513_c0_g1_i1.p1 TRINITY_DN19513_c0_g1~~TRINITY_DN19513_c0_g1_i1.p1  ORF type:complete len:158 (+),score=81.82 TRINITY_DN19513_c0_g1_i1:96-569(+)